MDLSGVTSNPYRQYVSSYKATKTETVAATEETDSDSYIDDIKDFACGALGIDQTNGESPEAGSYEFGQYVSAAVSVGKIVSLFV